MKNSAVLRRLDGLDCALEEAMIHGTQPVEFPFPVGDASARIRRQDTTERELSLTVREGQTTELSLEIPR